MTKPKSPKKINDDLLELFEHYSEIICYAYIRNYICKLSISDKNYPPEDFYLLKSKEYITNHKNDLENIHIDVHDIFKEYPNMTYKQNTLLYPGINLKIKKSFFTFYINAYKDDLEFEFTLSKNGEKDIVLYHDFSGDCTKFLAYEDWKKEYDNLKQQGKFDE